MSSYDSEYFNTPYVPMQIKNTGEGMDIREIVTSNLVKDMMAEADSKFIQNLNFQYADACNIQKRSKRRKRKRTGRRVLEQPIGKRRRRKPVYAPVTKPSNEVTIFEE